MIHQYCDGLGLLLLISKENKVGDTNCREGNLKQNNRTNKHVLEPRCLSSFLGSFFFSKEDNIFIKVLRKDKIFFVCVWISYGNC